MSDCTELTGGIEEATYGSFSGRLDWRNGCAEPVILALEVDGVRVASAPLEHGRFELNVGRTIVPTERVEVVAFDSGNRCIERFAWGEIDRSLPEAWVLDDHYGLPSFFLLGAAKCGTTSLHFYLDKHPDIFMSKPKEPFFFEAEYQRGPSFYFNKYFGGWRGERVVGESRHRNLYLPYVAERIFKYNPEAKLIAVLRNPAERALSHWWHWRSRNLERLSALDAFEADHQRISAGKTVTSLAEIDQYVSTLGPHAQGEYRTYLDTGYYSDQLERYLRLFRRDQLLVVLFEDLIREPAETLRNIFRFLAVAEGPVNSVEFLNWHPSPPGMWAQVDDETWHWLVDHYKMPNRRLEELLQRRLALWDNRFR